MFKDIKQVMKDSVLYGIGNVAVKLVGFILIPLYTDAEYFSTADYGLMGLLEVIEPCLGVVVVPTVAQRVDFCLGAGA